MEDRTGYGGMSQAQQKVALVIVSVLLTGCSIYWISWPLFVYLVHKAMETP